MIIVETKIIYGWLGIKQNSIFCIWTWVSTYTYVLCMNPSPSRHQWPYENLYECWWTFPLETHIQIHTRLKTTMEAPGAGKVHPRSQVHKYPLAIPKEVFSWYEPNRLSVEVQKLQVCQLFQVCFHRLEWVNLSGLLGGTQNMNGLAQISEQAWKQTRTHHHLLHTSCIFTYLTSLLTILNSLKYPSWPCLHDDLLFSWQETRGRHSTFWSFPWLLNSHHSQFNCVCVCVCVCVCMRAHF